MKFHHRDQATLYACGEQTLKLGQPFVFRRKKKGFNFLPLSVYTANISAVLTVLLTAVLHFRQ